MAPPQPPKRPTTQNDASTAAQPAEARAPQTITPAAPHQHPEDIEQYDRNWIAHDIGEAYEAAMKKLPPRKRPRPRSDRSNTLRATARPPTSCARRCPTPPRSSAWRSRATPAPRGGASEPVVDHAGPRSGFHDPLLNDQQRAARFPDATPEDGALVSNGYKSVRNRVAAERNREVRDIVRQCEA